MKYFLFYLSMICSIYGCQSIKSEKTNKSSLVKEAIIPSHFESYFSQLKQAKITGQAIPLHQQLSTEKLTLDQAYLIQQALLEELPKGKRIGFKAGLTTKKGQQKFQINSPIAGLMFSPYVHHHSKKNTIIDLNEFIKPMIEIELGFTLKKIPQHTITDTTTLIKYIDKLYPIIELPDLGFKTGSLSAADVVANNCAFHSLIIGQATPFNHRLAEKINSLKVSLSHNNIRIIQAQTNSVMGNQLLSLQWLINHAINQGYNLNKEDIFITGALGKMLPNKAGIYQANFEELGTISFSAAEH